MRIAVTNRHLLLIADSPEESARASRFARDTAFKVEGVEWTPAVREGRWDGCETLLKRAAPGAFYTLLPPGPTPTPGPSRGAGERDDRAPPGHSLWTGPVGLADAALDTFPRARVLDWRRPLGQTIRIEYDPDVIKDLRPYQHEAVEAILSDAGVVTGKGLVRLPTRAGKTVIAGKVIARVGGRAGFIVNSSMLLTQTVRFLSKALRALDPIPGGLPLVGQWGGGVYQLGWITVVSVQAVTHHITNPIKRYKGQAKLVRAALLKVARARYESEDKARDAIENELSKVTDNLCQPGWGWSAANGQIEKVRVTQHPERFARAAARHRELQEVFGSWDVLFFDECHHLESELWREAMMLADARYKIGLSATIHIDHDEGTPRPTIWLLASTGPIIYSLTPSVLIEAGWLCRPEIRFENAPDPGGAPRGDTFAAIYKWGIVQNTGRNRRIAELAEHEKSRRHRVLVTVRYIDHAKLVVKACKARKLRCAVIIGETGEAERDEIIGQLRRREIDVLIGTVFKEAVDLPFLECVIIADALASKILTLQRLRNLTPVDENDCVIQEPMNPPTIVPVYEFADFGHTILRDHTMKRLDEYCEHSAFRVRWSR